MADKDYSPAVQSMKKEQTEQKKHERGELTRSLEQTFPASDPMSTTHSSIPSGRIDLDEARKVAEEFEYRGKSLRVQIENYVRHRPLMALGIAAAVGYLCGISR